MLADDVARVLASEAFGLPGREVARRVRRRRCKVVAVLRGDQRFVHDGRGRASRWRMARWGVAAGMPRDHHQDNMGHEDMPWLGLDASGVPLVRRRAAGTS
jgi:hypothetical protein